MSEEPKGFCNDSQELIERQNSVCTKRGVIIYKGRGDQWYIDFPDDTERIGGVTTIKLMTLIYYLKEFNGNIDRSRKELGWE
ncbi:MAG: hypothetical protein ABSC20_05790 [Candidatus Bathyarchaeia archaeon]|jgi:hypothetical protein